MPNEQPPVGDARLTWLPRPVDIKALLGYESISTAQIYINVGQAGWRWQGCEERVGGRMAKSKT